MEISSSYIAHNLHRLTARKTKSCSIHRARSIYLRVFSRAFVTSRACPEHAEQSHIPRWRETPRAMKAPFRTRLKPVGNDYIVNEDPEVLDQAYRRMLGSRGDKMLSEEVKWLAVTHKSFDQGRRGFNDRLAYFGTESIFRYCNINHNNLHYRSANTRTANFPCAAKYATPKFTDAGPRFRRFDR